MILKNIHRKDWRRILSFSACFLFAVTVSVSCKKTPANFGTDALSPEDLLASGGIDTFSLNTYSVIEDSLPTDNQIYALLGSMHDPKTGITNAAFNTQFSFLGAITHTAGSVPVIDSVVLSLKYGGYYGKIEQNTFQVFQLLQDLDIDETYYKSTQTLYSALDLVEPGSAVQTPNFEDEIPLANFDTVKPQLRLKLDNSWGYDMVNEAINGAAFANDADFKDFFKGIKVKVQETNPAAGHGGIIYFDLDHAETKITFYYKIVGDTTPYSFDVVITDDDADYNEVDVNNNGYHINDVLNDHSNGLSQFYTQAFESRAVVEFPGVSDIPKNRVIHSALLELPVAYQTQNLYYPSIRLDVVIETDDYVAFGQVIYDEESKRYVINIRDYIQSIVNGESDNKGVFLNPRYFTGTAERIVFNGAGSSYKTKPKLIIKYTQF